MMAVLHGSKWWDVKWVAGRVLIAFLLVSASVASLQNTAASNETKGVEANHHAEVFHKHTWPGMRFGWRIIMGTVIGFLGSAFGSIGGVGGGGIFVSMLTLIIGFDAKSATAISKCMITGGAGATVFYNLKQRHPTLDLPVIDYDLALLLQPMLMLGISIGVGFNVIFPDWIITILLLIVLIGISANAFLKGVNTWKKETLIKKEARQNSQLSDIGRAEDAAHDRQAGDPVNGSQTGTNQSKKNVVKKYIYFLLPCPNLIFLMKSNTSVQDSVFENVYWKELGLLLSVWIMILALQIGRNHTTTCSVLYWILNLLQVPIAVGMSSYEAVLLYKGQRVIASKGNQQMHWRVQQLILYCTCGIFGGIIGGMLGLGGGFILGPLFLSLGIPPQVSSATSTFAMTFSASMAVVEYYLLKRFPIPYTLYLVAIAIAAALVGQHLVGKLIAILGRASVIIFILALTLFVSAILIGGTGVANLIKGNEKEYMRFGNICT